MAHRDDTGGGPGANDNASGTAALIELARSYGTPAAAAGARALSPPHTLVFLSTDGGAFGGARRAPLRADASRSRASPSSTSTRSPAAGRRGSRSPARSPAWRRRGSSRRPRSACSSRRAAAATGRPARAAHRPRLPVHALRAGAVARRTGIPALTLTTGGERPPIAFADRADRLDGTRLASLGRAAQQLLRSLDAGAELAQGTAALRLLRPARSCPAGRSSSS